MEHHMAAMAPTPIDMPTGIAPPADTVVQEMHAIQTVSDLTVGGKRKRDDFNTDDINSLHSSNMHHHHFAGTVESGSLDLPLRVDHPHDMSLRRDYELNQYSLLQPLSVVGSSGADASAPGVSFDNAQQQHQQHHQQQQLQFQQHQFQQQQQLQETPLYQQQLNQQQQQQLVGDDIATTNDSTTATEPPAKRQYSFIPDGIKERAIVLVLQHKCSVSDIAELMGVSRGALYKHIERARKQLDDSARARVNGERHHMSPAAAAVAAATAAAAKVDTATQSSAQMKALVAKLKTTVQKTPLPASTSSSSSAVVAPPPSSSLDSMTAAAVAAATSADTNVANSVVL